MIYCELTQGTTTAYLSATGIERNDQWYDVAILDIGNLNYSLNGGYIKSNECEIVINKEYLKNFDLSNRVFDINLYYTTTDTLLFKGRAIITDDDEISVTFLLRSDEYSINLLDDAPDLNDLTNRVYYRGFGINKFVEPLLLDDVNLIYHWAYCTFVNVYDDGVNINTNVTDNGDGTFTLSAAPVGTVTMDINSIESSIIDVATFVAGRLGLSIDTTYANTVNINTYVMNQIDSLNFLSQVCVYANHFFLIDNISSTTPILKLIGRCKTFADAITIVTKTDFDILKDNLGKSYNDIVKQYTATWQKRESLQNPQRVESHDATITIDTGYNVGQIINVQVYDYIDTNISAVLTDKNTLNNLHQIELKLPDICLNLTDIGKVIKIEADGIVDSTVDNWIQIVELDLDFKEAETTIRGQGQIFWA